MRNVRILFLSFIALILFQPCFFAAETAPAVPTVPEDKSAAVVKPPKEMTEAEKKKLKAERERQGKAKEGLNGSSWQVSIQSMDAKQKPDKDTFTFQDTEFKSDFFIGKGYAPTNYTVTMMGDSGERAQFETMMSGKGGMVFLRGEWEKEVMSGTITEQLEGGKKVNEYYFTTSGRKAIPPVSEKAQKAEAAAQTTAPQTTENTVQETSHVTPSGALVSKESQGEVSSFVPGTTQESR